MVLSIKSSPIPLTASFHVITKMLWCLIEWRGKRDAYTKAKNSSRGLGLIWHHHTNGKQTPCSKSGACIYLAEKRSPLVFKLPTEIEAVHINNLVLHNAPSISTPCHYNHFCSIISTPNHQIPPFSPVCFSIVGLALQTAPKWACFARPAASQTNHPSAIIEIFWVMIDWGNHWAGWVGSSVWPLHPCCWLIVGEG